MHQNQGALHATDSVVLTFRFPQGWNTTASILGWSPINMKKNALLPPIPSKRKTLLTLREKKTNEKCLSPHPPKKGWKMLPSPEEEKHTHVARPGPPPLHPPPTSPCYTTEAGGYFSKDPASQYHAYRKTMHESIMYTCRPCMKVQCVQADHTWKYNVHRQTMHKSIMCTGRSWLKYNVRMEGPARKCNLHRQ